MKSEKLQTVSSGNEVDAGLLEEDCYESAKPAGFKRLIKNLNKRRFSYLFYAFIIPVILNYFVYLSMGLHPFGNGSVLVLDLNGQYVYFYEALRNAVYGETSLIYSFCRTMGGEFFGIYAYYIASPFSYIVCLFPQERILEALLCIFLLKAGISGMTMAYYLDKISSKLNKISVVTFSVLYAMCAYAIVQQHNSMWIDALMWLPLLVLGIESLIREGKFKLYTVMLALIMMSNFYIGYMSCIFTLIYFFYYYFSRNEKTSGSFVRRNNTLGEKNHFIRSLLRIGLFSLIAIGIAMVILATSLYSLSFGKNTFSDPDFSFSLRYDLMDFFTRLLPGAYDTVRPEGLPFIYCGVLTLYCVPAYFFSKKFSGREKAFAFGILALLFLCFSINTLDMIWHGFQKPNWLNYRYSFMMSFLLVVFGYKGFGEMQKLSNRVIAGTGAIAVIFIMIAQKFNFESYVDRLSGDVEFNQKLEELEIIWFSLLCFVVFGILLLVLIQSKNKKGLSLVICVFVCIEAFGNAIALDSEFGEDVIYSSYSSYNDFVSSLRPLCEDILEEDTGFYRFEKNAHRKYCDNMALNIRGLTCSTSTLNKSTIEFLENIGYASRSHWSKYLGYTLLNDSLIGMKYVIASEKDTTALYYEKTDIESQKVNQTIYYVYKNPYALSLAYAVGDGVLDVSMEEDTPMIVLNNLMKAMTNDSILGQCFQEVDYTITTSNCNQSTIAGHTKYTHIKEGSDATVTYSFTALQDGEVFFYLPTDYWREVQVRVNGKALGNFYSSENSRIFSLGTFEEGEDVNVNLTLDCDVLYVKNGVCSIYYLDLDRTKSALTKLASEQMTIDEGWTETDLKGSITTTAADRLIQTTLPWDEGWHVYVDGEKVETFETLGALVAFRIDTIGEHTVEFKYSPTCYVLGLTVTISSLALFVLIVIFEKKLRKILGRIFNGKNPAPVPADDSVDEIWDTTEYKLVDIFPEKNEENQVSTETAESPAAHGETAVTETKDDTAGSENDSSAGTDTNGEI